MQGAVKHKDGTTDKTEVHMKFRPNMGKKDIEAYLKQVYGMDVAQINTAVYSQRLRRKPTGGWKIKKVGYKKAFVTLRGIDPDFKLPDYSLPAKAPEETAQTTSK
jgi:ribosomal protein L23